ncbi:hypothetical protein BDC45DRAFT_434002, partial [Circinella umbellata]
LIGLARKTPGKEADNVRTQLLEKIAAHLRTRSLVDKVLISPSCKSSEPIENRDHKEDVIGSYADGNAQGMLDMLKKTRKSMVIVIIDYAGLTTDPDDLLLFIRYVIKEILRYNFM